MSWLARSIAKTLLPPDDDDEEPSAAAADPSPAGGDGLHISAADSGADIAPESPTKGVREDISELTKTLTRQFRGFASFLAPPPTTTQAQPETLDDDVEASDSLTPVAGIRNDFAEIGGRVRSGISKISGHVNVAEIAKIASTLLPLGPDDGDDEDLEEREGTGEVIGVTEEVIAFVTNISMHPETWLDFPLLPDEEDCDDFEMTDVQQDHALAVERIEPTLAALRIELCPRHMSESCFWKIYFVLLHPRLNKLDADFLSSPQIVEARARLSVKLQNQNKSESESSTLLEAPQVKPDQITTPLETVTEPSKVIYEETLTTIPIDNIAETEKEKYPVTVTEVKIIDKSVIEQEEIRAKEIPIQKSDEEGDEGDDEWLREETGGVSVNSGVPLGDDEDVSFSDLEEDDDKK